MPTTSWRITVNEIDKTTTIGTSPEKNCATVLIAPKGAKVWTFYDQGSTQSILNNFGYPSASYPAIQDVIDVNKHSGVWLCAPYKNGKYGGVVVTQSGTLSIGGYSTPSITNYSGVLCTAPLFTGNGSKVTYSGTLPNYQYYNAKSIDIQVNGVTVITSVSGTNPETINSAQGTGTFNKTTGTLVFTFNTAPISGALITANSTINISSIAYFTLFNYNQQADDLFVQVTQNNTISGAFNIAVSRYDTPSASYVDLGESPYTIGLTPSSKDGNGTNIYISNVFNDDAQLFIPTVQNSIFNTFVDDVSLVGLNGGSRGDAIVASDLSTYYDLLLDTNKYSTNLIFDTTGFPAVATEFSSLRSQKELKYTSFALPTADLSATAIIADPVTAKNSVANRGIFYYCLTWGLRTDLYQGNDFNCSNMGLIASKIMDSMINDPSIQPMYFNENNNCGGQLDSGIIKLNQSATQTQLSKLDGYHLNPIVIDPQYGAWIVGARTTQSKESVYSYIAQSVEADLIIRDLLANVLTPQQGKANDDYHRGVAKSNSEAILDRYKAGLDDSFVKCDRKNNTDIMLNQQKFILSVAVRYVSYAMTITLNFVTTPFGTDVTESLS